MSPNAVIFQALPVREGEAVILKSSKMRIFLLSKTLVSACISNVYPFKGTRGHFTPKSVCRFFAVYAPVQNTTVSQGIDFPTFPAREMLDTRPDWTSRIFKSLTSEFKSKWKFGLSINFASNLLVKL